MGNVDIPVLDSITKISNEGGEHFDAAGWHYLDALARRAGVLRSLGVKAQEA